MAIGSCARGKARNHSDIDIAIMPRDDLPYGFFAELEDAIGESTMPYDVDLVDLRKADPALIAESAATASRGGIRRAPR
jgi:uncharacterized protein